MRTGFILGALLLLGVAPVKGEEARPIRATLRAVFGGGNYLNWQGTLTVTGGRIVEVKNFLMDPGERGTYGVTNSAFSWDSFTTGGEDGFIVTVEGSLDMTLSITGKPFEKRVTLREVLTGPVVVPVEKAQFCLGRDPGDVLRMTIKGREHMVLLPGEELQATLAINDIATTPTSGSLKAGLASAFVSLSDHRSEPIRNQEVSLTPNEIKELPIACTAPKQDGVYELRAVLTGLPDGPKQTGLEFVVIDPAFKRSPAKTLKKLLVDEVDCTAKLAPERFLEQGDTTVETTGLGTFRYTSTRSLCLFETKKPVEDNISWFACRLKADHLGEPHLLEVTYPDDDWRSIGISVIQPGPSNKVDWDQLDSGVVCGGDNPSDGQVKVHRILIWPTVRNPVVLITNRFPGHRAAVGMVRLFYLPDGLTELKVPVLPVGTRRHMGFYYEESRMGETFSGPRRQPQLGVVTENPRGWLFFYKSARNMVDYMKYAGLDCVDYLSVGYGDALYPSKLAELSDRYDDPGLDQDPMRKDLLEMYMRLFDRENLAFIPEINLHRGVPSFEAGHSAGTPGGVSARMVRKDGSILDPMKIEAGGPCYDPLHPAWQTFVLSLVREMAERYASHPSFLGIDMRLNTNVSLAYPNLDWGYGDDTMALFQKETGIVLPGAAKDPKRFEERHHFLTTEKREEFVAWRCKKIHDFHQKIAATLAAVRPDLKLYLGFMNCFDSNFDGAVNVGWEKRVLAHDYLREKGIDLALYVNASNTVVFRPRREMDEKSGEFAKERTFDPKIDELFLNPGLPTGLKIFNEYHESFLPGFDRKSAQNGAGWFADSRLWLVGTHVPSEPHYLKRYAQAMNRLNPMYLLDGGWQIPYGREDQLRDFARVYRQLPAVPFHRLALASQPVGVHVAEHHGEGWIYLVNESFAPAEATLDLSCPGAREILSISDGAILPVKNGRIEVTVRIGANLLAAYKSSVGPIQVRGAKVIPGKPYLDWLEKRYQQVVGQLAGQKGEEIQVLLKSMASARDEKRWVDLWQHLESAKVYQALIQSGVKPPEFYSFEPHAKTP